MVSGSVPESVSDVQQRIISVFNAVLSEDLKISIIQLRPSVMSAIFYWAAFLWNCSTIFRCSLVNFSSSLRQMKSSFYIQSCDWVVICSSIYFSSLLLPFFQLLWDVLLPWSNFHEIVKYLFHHLMGFFLCSIGNKIWLIRFANHCIPLLIPFYTLIQLFLDFDL